MRRLRALTVAITALLLSGCGVIHFGRLPESAKVMGDAKMAEAYSNLTTEHKILKQELALARRETDTLRVALERTAGAAAQTSPADVARLNETAAELAQLRASYAKLQAERASTAAPSTQLRELEEKLAASLRDYTQLQAENTRLRGELERVRGENISLAERLKSATEQYDQAQLAVAQLNTELLAQKQARARAEQATDGLRAQLGTVMAQAAAAGASPLQIAKAPPAGASPTAELRTSTEHLLRSPPAVPDQPAATKPVRKHVVQAGDTLEKLSQRYYGAPDRWPAIYEANSGLLGAGQPLRPGMELTIPE